MTLRSTKPPSTRRSLLRRVPALRLCTDDELLRIESLVHENGVPAGQELMGAGREDGEVSVIADGWAAVMVDDEPAAALGPGDLVALPNSPDAARTGLRIVAKTDMRVITVPRRALDG